MESAMVDSLWIRRTDPVLNRPIAASLVYPCIGLLPAFEARPLEGRNQSWQNYPRTPPFRTPASPESHRLAQPRSRFNATHFHKNRYEHIQDKFPSGTQPLFLGTATVFGVSHIKVDVSDGSIGILDEPARHEVVEMIRGRAEGNRFVSRGPISLPRAQERAESEIAYLCVSGRESFKPNAASSRAIPLNNQGLSAKPPTKKTNCFEGVSGNCVGRKRYLRLPYSRDLNHPRWL